MHLLLREHGWEPIDHSEGRPTFWRWKKHGQQEWIDTWTPLEGAKNPSWDLYHAGGRVGGRSPRRLEKCLKELDRRRPG